MYSLGLFILLLVSGGALAEDVPGTTHGLTLQEAVTIALDHHPNLLAARGTVQAQTARVGEARANFLPHLDLTSDYTRTTSNVAPSSRSSSLTPSTTSGSSNTSFNNYSAGLSLQQRIYDFGKTGAEVAAANEALDATRWDQEASRQSVVFNVKGAYFGLLKARRLVHVDEETVGQFEEHLRQVEGFYQAGIRTQFDVTKAQVDLTNARLALITARNAAEVARATLANAIGVPDHPIGEIEDVLGFEKVDIVADEAIKEALAHRPELLSISAEHRAREAALRSATRNDFPVLSGTADYTYRGEDFPLAWNWSAGINLTVPLFSGYLTRSQIAEARANLAVVGANEETIRQTILLEIHQAYSNLIEAEERVQTSALVVRQAEENLALANGRFQAGVGASVERTDAQVQLTNAKTAQIQALYDYRIDHAQIEKAMGRGE
ncbi:MAG: TolC family protein [Nitrospirae bacterium]|nr:TolC family protein [Nitrospirota bacterium]